MALNVQWRWNMPQVADPDKVGASNRDYFLQGMGAIGEGITKAGENRRADEKQKWLEEMEEAKLEHQKYQDALAQRNNVRDYALLNRKFGHLVEQDALDQLNKNRDYMLRRDMYNLNKAKQDYDMGRTTRQDQWLEKLYDQYVGSTDPFESEYESLREELSHIDPWQLKMLMGD